MRTLTQKQSQPKKPVSSSLARPNVATPGSDPPEHSLLSLQRAIGNHAAQPLLQTHAEGRQAGGTAATSPRLGHDFSWIPIHPPAAGTIQTKLAINQPGDEYEQEADRVAEQVMRMPEPSHATVQKKSCDGCTAGAPCPECADKKEGLIQRKGESVFDPTATSVPEDFLKGLGPGQPLDAATRAFFEPRFGHDFSRVQIHSEVPLARSSSAQSMSIDGLRAISSPGGHGNFFINGPGDGSKPTPNPPPPVTKPQTPPARAASNCPTDIQVAAVGPATDVDFGKDGFLTGWGGIALMEVSDPNGKTWDGTAVHENLRNIKNTCGDRGKDICSNKSGERGGTAGSTFKVGEESNFLGKAKLPAAKNRFHDLHVFSTKEASLLHELKKESCEVQCEQSYDCGGKRFGPEFIITYSMTRDVVKAGARSIDVTRVEVKKGAAAKRTPPPAPSSGVKP